MSEVAAAPAAKSAPSAAKPSPAAKAPDGKKPLEPLKRNHLELFEFRNNVWRGTAPAGVSAQELSEHPLFWATVAAELKQFDSIRMVAADLSWVADYIVCSCSSMHATVKMLFSISMPARTTQGAKPIPQDWEIVETGPDEAPGFVCINYKTNVRILDSGLPFPNFEAARDGLLGHAMFRTDEQPRYVP